MNFGSSLEALFINGRVVFKGKIGPVKLLRINPTIFFICYNHKIVLVDLKFFLTSSSQTNGLILIAYLSESPEGHC